MNPTRPYLVIPKLIEQPTWGGSYIVETKSWQNSPIVRGRKIGQSYELFSGSKLALTITDTMDSRFIPELGFADTTDTIKDNFNLAESTDYMRLSDYLKNNPGDSMPLLIKFTQALGNSFQIHIKNGETDPKWKPKAESWYYFEPGFLTYGIKSGANLDNYKNVCLTINEFMKSLSSKIKAHSLDLISAGLEAQKFIASQNPWQFVNVYESEKFEAIDLSQGGIHHSWEQNMTKYPLGNVLYEIQEDVMDPVSTIRSFDQGKIKNDGSIREIAIYDYFKYLDTDETRNNINLNRQIRSGNRVLTTPIYSMDVLELQHKVTQETENSFNHVFVRDGAVEVATDEVKLKIGRGHSCFIPKNVGEYEISPLLPNSVILTTYLTNN